MFNIRNVLVKEYFNGKYIFKLSKRTKHLPQKKEPKAKALAHFDDFYKALFKKKWPSIRLALLSKGKSVAVINNFGDVEEAENLLQQEGALELQKFLQHLKSQNYGSNVRTANSDVDDTIEMKIQEIREKDLSMIHPHTNNMDLLSTKENNNEDDNNEDEFRKKEEEMFDITEARSSLHYDKSVAEYEKTRLVMPESGSDKSVFYDYVPATKLRGVEGYVLESDYYKYYSGKSVTKVEIVPEEEITFPEHLKVYSFDRGDVTEFPEAKLNSIGIYDFLEMDGADILPVLALDVQPGDYVLHLGYNSGNMGYCLLQTLRPKFLVCSGSKEFESTFQHYLYEYSNNWNDMLYVTSKDFMKLSEGQSDNFDKILVDVPSTDDKNALLDPENNLFRSSQVKTRLELPKQQTDILAFALKVVRPGGTVVYTTSTLSPVQNDSVVNEALNIIWGETKMSFTVKDLSPALNHMSFFYRFDKHLQTKYGTLILPFMPINFGPRYFCKIVKNEI